MKTRKLSASRAGAGHLAWPVTCLAAVALIASAVVAGNPGDMSPSGSGAGGDSVGSLPLMAGPLGGPDVHSAGQPDGEYTSDLEPALTRPILALVGTQAELDAVIYDAYGTGSVEVVDLGSGLMRYEFYGRITVELRRTQFQSSLVSAQILVGSSFQGAQAKLKVNGVLKAKQILTEGARDIHLHKLVQAGIVDEGMNWHAISTQGVHAVLGISGKSSNLIRLDQRD